MLNRTRDVLIPQVGRFSVAGLYFRELPLNLSIVRVFRNFEIGVNMPQLHSIPVFVIAMREGRERIATGRIVLDLKPESRGVEELPEMP